MFDNYSPPFDEIFHDIQVPVFAFGSAGPDLIVTSSNSGLPGQEGLDRTAMDIQQFARGGDLVQAQDGAEEEEIEVDESEEGGVSSIVSSSEQQGGARPSRARQVITWEEGSSSGTSSSSPQRQNPVVRNDDDDNDENDVHDDDDDDNDQLNSLLLQARGGLRGLARGRRGTGRRGQ